VQLLSGLGLRAVRHFDMASYLPCEAIPHINKEMENMLRLIGLGLVLVGTYYLGRNIIFTTDVYPWWRGIAADASILALVSGSVLLFTLPRGLRSFGWLLILAGIVLVFMSSRAILNPTSLWEFFISVVSIVAGYRMLTARRSIF